MTKTFELRIQDECLSADPKDRPTMQSLRTDRLFTTDFLEIAYFLKNIALQPDDKRRQFFRELLPKLLALPEDLVGHRLVPLLLSRFVLLDQSAVTYILPHLLTPGPDDATGCEETTSLFSESLYSRFIIPTLVKIFTVHDHHIRMILLRYFHTYVHLISRDDLELDVFPQVLLGLRDTSDALAAASLRALAHLVPILGRDFVIGGKSKKYFKESMPKMPAPEPTMNNKLSNVQGIMGRKPLLKDLAVYSKGNKDTGMKASEIVDTTEKKESKAASREGGKETGRKWKERECRKQEMRQRREERRRAREAKTLDAENVQPEAIQTHVAAVNSSTVGEQTPNTNASAHNRESEIFKSTNISNADGNHVMCNTNTDWADDEHAQSDNESDWSIESANSAVNVPEKDDWSDWDDKGGNSDISDEIEKELHNMPSTVQYRSEHKKPHPVTHSTEDKGAHISKASDKLTGTQGNIENISSVSPHSTILPSKTKQSLPKSNPARKVPISMTTNQHPWENLDIKNITISVDRSTSSEFDFFVDMTPKFEPTSKELEIGKMSENMYDMNRNPSDFQLERVQNSPKSPVEKSSFGASHMTYKGHMSEVNTSTDGPGSTITFGVVDNTAEVPADGWGEDFDDWGNDNS